MNIKVPNTNQIPPIDTSTLNGFKAVRTEHLHRAHQEKVNEYYKVKKQDFETNRAHLNDWEYKKDIDEVNRYLNIKRNVEYRLFQYSKYLGKHIDVLV
jgi:ribosomal protein S17E